jgi:hypothetical protein
MLDQSFWGRYLAQVHERGPTAWIQELQLTVEPYNEQSSSSDWGLPPLPKLKSGELYP